MSVCLYGCLCVGTQVRMNGWIDVCLHVCIYAPMSVFVGVCVYIYIYIYIYTHVSIMYVGHVCMYICV
eukprot:NODE_2352_length_798_cov_1223.723632_g568_i3.p5 GENE.NODE_2352_length_798_cov_1223.723632_g568_i3~~NODE_2352_length_798_cov_1223.723632_g568_i3.p5  ORF type:complete len:68 (+),score=16.23 NODE_2352_length_798_cov_1223.723632_g568_i3:395-598(+)